MSQSVPEHDEEFHLAPDSQASGLHHEHLLSTLALAGLPHLANSGHRARPPPLARPSAAYPWVPTNLPRATVVSTHTRMP